MENADYSNVYGTTTRPPDKAKRPDRVVRGVSRFASLPRRGQAVAGGPLVRER
jgi:hypothetical protein